MTSLFNIKPRIPHLLVVVGGFLLLIGTVLHIISMSTDYFALLKDGDAKYAAVTITRRLSLSDLSGVDAQLNYGLWRLCVGSASLSQKNQRQCYDFSTHGSAANDIITTPYWLKSAQILSIVSVIVAGVGVVAVIAWAGTDMASCVNLFLVIAATLAASGGILILSSDITFAAKFSVEPYYIIGNSIYFTAATSDPARRALEIGTLDTLLDFGWSFALDIAAGSICVLSSLPLMVVSVWTARPERAKSSTKSQENRTSKHRVSSRT